MSPGVCDICKRSPASLDHSGFMLCAGCTALADAAAPNLPMAKALLDLVLPLDSERGCRPTPPERPPVGVPEGRLDDGAPLDRTVSA